MGDWKQLRAVRVGHTVGQSGSPRFGERHGCPTKGSPRPLVVFDRLLYLFSPSDARLSSYVQQSLGSLFARSLTLLKRPLSNLRPYFARLRLPLLKKERGWNDFEWLEWIYQSETLASVHDAVRREIVDRFPGRRARFSSLSYFRFLLYRGW